MREISQLDAPAPRAGADPERGASGGAWAVVIPAERHEKERLFHHDTLELAGLDGGQRPAVGDDVLVVTEGEQPTAVALGRIAPARGGSAGNGAGPDLVVAYTRRCFDDPVPAGELDLRGPLTPLDPATFQEFAARFGPATARASWLVSVDLPIEAPSAAEAVRLFWSYVRELGPRELPTFVSPSGNELAMQAYVLGEEANLDPEEED